MSHRVLRPVELSLRPIVARRMSIALFLVAIFGVGKAGAQILLPQPGVINTLAGNGTAGYSGDSGQATTAELNGVAGVAADASGNLYIADYSNNVIRKVTASTGVITTIVGNGSAGYTGDGGPAINAELNSPNAIKVDTNGDIYIADLSNNVIRKISSSTGVISTVAGNSTQGYFGDGGPATSAGLTIPSDILLDSSGNLYIADAFNNVVRKVTISTGIITTVAGNNTQGYSGDGGPAVSAELSFPWSLSIDSTGNLYIADSGNNVIRKVDASTGIISTVVGNGAQTYAGDNGPATQASLNSPGGLAIDSIGNIYISDSGSNVIRKVTASTGIITTIAGSNLAGYSGDGGSAVAGDGTPGFVSTSGAVVASLNSPLGLAVAASANYVSGVNLYFADSANNVIRTVGALRTFAPTFSPISATYSSAQSVTVSDSLSGATIYYTTDGSTPTTSSAVYSAPISVSSTSTLNAIAITSGGLSSAVGTAPYTITTTSPTIDYSAGFQSSSMNLVGATINNGIVQLTDTNQDEERAAWFTTPSEYSGLHYRFHLSDNVTGGGWDHICAPELCGRGQCRRRRWRPAGLWRNRFQCRDQAGPL